MAKGIDTQANCWQSVDCLKSAGIAFVCRYYNVKNPAKNLTRTEAGILIAAGLTVVSVWENGFPTRADYFTTGQGEQDATGALKVADAVGQISGAVYFAVDYDASAADIAGPISHYFEGIESVFTGDLEIVVYGSGAVCSAMLSGGYAGWSWLSQSMGWSGSKGFAADIMQGATTKICGLSVDTDEADPGNCGGFTSLQS